MRFQHKIVEINLTMNVNLWRTSFRSFCMRPYHINLREQIYDSDCRRGWNTNESCCIPCNPAVDFCCPFIAKLVFKSRQEVRHISCLSTNQFNSREQSLRPYNRYVFVHCGCKSSLLLENVREPICWLTVKSSSRQNAHVTNFLNNIICRSAIFKPTICILVYN